MRHILILISILLLSSFLISCDKNGPGTETYVGGSSYEGVFKDGKPHCHVLVQRELEFSMY